MNNKLNTEIFDIVNKYVGNKLPNNQKDVKKKLNFWTNSVIMELYSIINECLINVNII